MLKLLSLRTVSVVLLQKIHSRDHNEDGLKKLKQSLENGFDSSMGELLACVEASSLTPAWKASVKWKDISVQDRNKSIVGAIKSGTIKVMLLDGEHRVTILEEHTGLDTICYFAVLLVDDKGICVDAVLQHQLSLNRNETVACLSEVASTPTALHCLPSAFCLYMHVHM